MTDPDGRIRSQTWIWERSTNGNSWTTISGAAGRRYTPANADLDHYLRASATYTDGQGPDKEAQVASDERTREQPAVNRPPVFSSTTVDRSVPENSTAGTPVGLPVEAGDDDGDILSYRLSGDANFVIDSDTGQIWVASLAALDHERRPTHRVVVTAVDPSSAAATTAVNISVGDVNEPPLFSQDSIAFEVRSGTPRVVTGSAGA